MTWRAIAARPWVEEREEGGGDGREKQILPNASSTRVRNPYLLSYMASYDVGSDIWKAQPWTPWKPGRRVIENTHSSRYRSTTYLQGECSYIRADSVRRFNVSRVLVLNDPPALDAVSVFAFFAGLGFFAASVNQGLADITLHVIDTHSEPSLLELHGIPSYDVASTICQALPPPPLPPPPLPPPLPQWAWARRQRSRA